MSDKKQELIDSAKAKLKKYIQDVGNTKVTNRKVLSGLQDTGYAVNELMKGTPYGVKIGQKLDVQLPDKPATDVGRGMGIATRNLPLFALTGGIGAAVKGVSRIRGVQNILGKQASNLISRGGANRLAGKGVANLSKGLPLTLGYQGYNSLQSASGNESYNSAKELGADLTFDFATGSVPVIGLAGTMGGKYAKSFVGKQGDGLVEQMIKKNARSNILNKKLEFFISDQMASPKEEVLSGIFKQLDSGTPRVAKSLGEVLDHKELFKEYPTAKNMTIVFDTNIPERGIYDPMSNAIGINPRGRNLPEILGTILHENQHYIQNIEDFGRGANPLEFSDNAMKQYRNTLSEIQARATQNFGDITNEQAFGRDLVSEQMAIDGIKPEDVINRKGSGVSADVGDSDTLKNFKSKIVDKPKGDKDSTIKQKVADLRTDWVDRFYPIKKITEVVEDKNKIKIRPEYSPEYAITQFQGSSVKAEYRHMRKLMPIIDEISDVNIDDFDAYLIAKRYLGFDEIGRDIKGVDPEEARKVILELEQKYDLSRLESTANKLYNYQDENLRNLVEAGFLDEDGYKLIKQQNPNYVPLNRLIDDETGEFIGTRTLQQSKNPINKIEGSEKEIISPLENIIKHTYMVENAVARNRVTKSLADLSKIDETVPIRAVKKAGDDVITVWEGGKKNYYQVPEDIARAVKGLNDEQLGTIAKILSFPAKVLRTSATGMNPEFFIPNAMRDQLDATINSEGSYLPYADYFRGLSHVMKDDFKGGDDLIRQWIESGGGIFMDSMSGDKTLREQLAESQLREPLRKKFKKFVKGVLSTASDYSEQPTRIAEFERVLKETGNPLIAAKASREVTLDFGTMGAKMRHANALIPFLNVNVQAFDKLVRVVKKDPKKFSKRMMLWGILPQAAVTAYNLTYHKNAYDNVPDYVKEGNYVLIYNEKEDGTPEYITIPKGHTVSLLANPVDNFLSYVNGVDSKSVYSLLLNTLGDVLPVLQGGDDLGEVASKTVGGNFPQAVKPIVEDRANYNFFYGSQIVPWYMEQNKLPEDQYFSSTESVYKKLGEISGISPLRIKNMLEGTLSSFVKIPVNVIENAVAKSRNQSAKADDVPIIRRFKNEGYSDERVEKIKEYEERDEKKRLELEAEKDPSILAEAQAFNASEVELPEKQEQFNRVYADTINDINRIQKQLEDLPYQNIDDRKASDKRSNLEGDLIYAQTLLKRLEEEAPEKVQQAEYYNLTKETNAVRGTIVKEHINQFAEAQRGDMLESLANMRRVVNGRMVLSDEVVNDLVREEIITKNEAKILKGFRINEDGKATVKISGRGRGAKLKKVKFVPSKISPARVKLPSPKSLSIDLPAQLKQQSLGVKPISIPELKVAKPQAPKFKVKFNL